MVRPGGLRRGPFSLPAMQGILHKAMDRGGAVSLADLDTLASPRQLGSCQVLPGSLVLGHFLGSGAEQGWRGKGDLPARWGLTLPLEIHHQAGSSGNF